MTKMITPEELAEIVTKLLCEEDLQVTVDGRSYPTFLDSVANAVCAYKGGEVQAVAYLDDEWCVLVQRGDTLPEGCDGPWGDYDIHGEL